MNDSSDISTNVNKPRSALKLGYADIDRVDSQPRHESMGLNEVTRFGKFTIFWINKQESNKLYDLVIELPFNCNVKTCINQAVNYLNEKMNKENSPYRLKNEASMYGLHYAKKNGQPKSDYPPFYDEQTLGQIGIVLMSLVERTPEALTRTDGQTIANVPITQPVSSTTPIVVPISSESRPESKSSPNTRDPSMVKQVHFPRPDDQKPNGNNSNNNNNGKYALEHSGNDQGGSSLFCCFRWFGGKRNNQNGDIKAPLLKQQSLNWLHLIYAALITSRKRICYPLSRAYSLPRIHFGQWLSQSWKICEQLFGLVSVYILSLIHI
eukprot:TRINITY_DN4213_c0_g1_i8.p1 TRINITY_DN4213_c0_g1~~TRINITY_DN4213_c0_g1_i8.p1  ORF type:complete len:323 (-),score=17.63 TRINITY_DN4213_c0_g1_i8:63-1031(-)